VPVPAPRDVLFHYRPPVGLGAPLVPLLAPPLFLVAVLQEDIGGALAAAILGVSALVAGTMSLALYGLIRLANRHARLELLSDGTFTSTVPTRFEAHVSQIAVVTISNGRPVRIHVTFRNGGERTVILRRRLARSSLDQLARAAAQVGMRLEVIR
jgi:hypothetical protein